MPSTSSSSKSKNRAQHGPFALLHLQFRLRLFCAFYLHALRPGVSCAPGNTRKAIEVAISAETVTSTGVRLTESNSSIARRFGVTRQWVSQVRREMGEIRRSEHQKLQQRKAEWNRRGREKRRLAKVLARAEAAALAAAEGNNDAT